MVRAGIGGVATECFLSRARAATPVSQEGARRRTQTLSTPAIKLAAVEHPDGAIFVIGCAPTALEQLIALVEAGSIRPALVIGVPVGKRGGSAVAAAIVNALCRLQPGRPQPGRL